MNESSGRALHDADRPEQQAQPPHVPMVYVSEAVSWEYKLVTRDLSQEGYLTEPALNELGAEGWELATLVVQEGEARYVFKRPG